MFLVVVVIVVVIMIVVAIVMAAFPCLFQFVSAPFGLFAVFSMLANGFVEVMLCLFDLAMAAIVIAVQGFGWQRAPCHKGCSEDQN